MIAIVTGTGTDVGKTIATATLALRLRSSFSAVHVIKPAQTGEPTGHGDLHTITHLTEITTTREFARFPDPLAPLTAAHHSGMTPLSLSETLHQLQDIASNPDELTLVEGAGGLLVELGLDDHGAPWTIADLASQLSAPVFVVTSTGLGSLNSVDLTLEALHHRGLECAGIIGGSLPAQPDLATRLNLEHFSRSLHPWLGAIPEGAGQLSPQEFQQQAPHWLAEPNIAR